MGAVLFVMYSVEQRNLHGGVYFYFTSLFLLGFRD